MKAMIKAESIYTIGHSTMRIDEFIMLLKKHMVTALVDVRSSPYSRHNPQFNRDKFEDSLKDHGIKYIFMGDALGARSDNPSCHEGGRVFYARLAEQAEFKKALDRIQEGSKEYRIALVCAEKEPLDCHRTILVAEELRKKGMDIVHILHDGSLEPHEKTLDRLLKRLNITKEDMFIDADQRVGDALKRQEEKIAYREQDSSFSGEGATA